MIRRHRWITLPSSAVMIVCWFLPVVRVCGKPTIPLEWPMFWTPYVVAGLVFAAALVRPWSLRGIAIALRVIIGLTVVGFGTLVMFDGEGFALVGIGALTITIVLAITLPAKSDEAMCARCGFFVALPSCLWFGAIALDKDALFGAYLSFAAAIAMWIGCAWWWGESEAAAQRVP
ncbi:MAG TPA: hypothetical protein VFQ53_18915 [Kofleriaceae bacterium]|nr:hypothetical protein [Kofleriaceae bacterium]